MIGHLKHNERVNRYEWMNGITLIIEKPLKSCKIVIVDALVVFVVLLGGQIKLMRSMELIIVRMRC